jgi:hypothetical protein
MILILLPTLAAVVAAGREILTLRLSNAHLEATAMSNKVRIDALEILARANAVVEMELKQHRTEINALCIKVDGLDVRLDIQTRTMDRIEGKLDHLSQTLAGPVHQR